MDHSYLLMPSMPHSLEKEVEAWLEEAKRWNCTTIIVSSETLDRCSVSDWQKIERAVEHAAAGSESAIDDLAIVYTERDEDELVESMYAESLKHGVTLAPEEAKPLERARFRSCRSVAEELHESVESRFSIQYVSFLDPSDSSKPLFVSGWIEEVLGITTGLLEAPDRDWVHLNPRLGDLQSKELLNFNRFNTPRGLGPIDALIDSSDDPDELERARRRLELYRAKVFENEALRQEFPQFEETIKLGNQRIEILENYIASLENSRSWRYTAWFRRIFGTKV